MKKFIICSMAVAGLVAATSCGGSDAGTSDGGTSKADQVVDKLASVVVAEGGTFDRDCAKEQVDKMTESDLDTLITANVDDDVTLSDEGEALGDALAACITPAADTADTADTAASVGSVDVSGMSTDELREELVTQLLSATEGMTVDEGCVRDTVDQLSDDDLRIIVAAGEEGDPVVSDQANAIGAALVSCITDFGDDIGTSGTGSIPEGIEMTDALIDLFMTQLESSGLQADRACVEQALEGIDVAQLADVMNDPALMGTITACITP